MSLVIAAVTMFVNLAMQSPAYQQEIAQYRAQRVAELKADDGWLTVAGLFWLEPGKNAAGSAPGSDILLPTRAPSSLGSST